MQSKREMLPLWSVSIGALVHGSLLGYKGNEEKIGCSSLPVRRVLAAWQGQPWQARSSPSPHPTGEGKEMEGVNQPSDLLLPKNVELSATFGFTQIFRAAVNYPRALQMQTYLELMLFVQCSA